MVEEPNTVHPARQTDAPHPVPAEIGTGIRADILQTCRAHPLWQQLTALREAGEVAREDFGYERVREVFEESRSIERKDIGDRALVLLAADAEQFYEISYIDAHGNEQTIDPESVNGVLILLPTDFGDAR